MQEAFLWPNQRQKGPALVEVVSSPSLQVFKGGRSPLGGGGCKQCPSPIVGGAGWGGVNVTPGPSSSQVPAVAGTGKGWEGGRPP